MKSLGVILALALAGLQLLAVTLVVFSSYFTSERTLLDHARTQMFDVGSNVIQHTKGFLSPARNAAELSTALAENQIVRREERVLLEGLLFQQLRSAPQFAGAYYGDEEGNFVYVKRNGPDTFQTKTINTQAAVRTILIDRNESFQRIAVRSDPGDTYDPRVRPWYLAAKANLGSIWTDPYIFFTSRLPGITAATPVIGFDGLVQGVIGVDIEIQELSSFLAQLRIGKSGAALLVNRNGDVIAHPNLSLLTTRGEDGTLQFPSIAEIEDPVARAAFDGHLTEDGVQVDSPMHGDFKVGNVEYVSLIRPFGLDEIPWTIVTYAPKQDFIGTILENRAQNTLIAIGVAAATGLLGLALANRIHAPVRAFAVRSALISQGEIDADEPMPNTYRELENANTTLVNEISQRKKTETEYRLTFDMASRGMVYIDSSTGRILRVNERFAQLLGYDPKALVGVNFPSLLHPDEIDAVEAFSKSISEHAALGFEARAVRSDETEIWISFNGVVFQSDPDDSGYIIATIDDISQARAFEDKIATLNRDIAHVSRQQVMGELATGLAHELNQPLTALTQNVDAAIYLVENRPDSASEVRALLSEIDQQAHQAADIMRALRGFVRKEDNKPLVFGIYELLEQSRRLILSEARQNSVDVVIRRGSEIMVKAVRVQIAQVMVNLLRNAIDAMDDMETGKKRVIVSTEIKDGQLQINVEDTGPGVTEGVELFTQFETTKRDGMGLGLSISRTIVEANGGKIWHDDVPAGARFSFTLPIEDS